MELHLCLGYGATIRAPHNRREVVFELRKSLPRFRAVKGYRLVKKEIHVQAVSAIDKDIGCGVVFGLRHHPKEALKPFRGHPIKVYRYGIQISGVLIRIVAPNKGCRGHYGKLSTLRPMEGLGVVLEQDAVYVLLSLFAEYNRVVSPMAIARVVYLLNSRVRLPCPLLVLLTLSLLEAIIEAPATLKECINERR